MKSSARDDDYYGYDFLPFVGIVRELNSDNIRARVRIFGIHNIEDQVSVSDGDLPWAVISYPVDATTPHTIQVDTWVVGFFADGRNAQQPVITGTFARGFSGPTSGSDVFARQGPHTGGGTNPGGGGGGGGTNNPLPPTTQTVNIPGGSNLEKAYNFIYNKLVSENLSVNPKMHTAAFVGVLMTESYNVTFLSGAPANDLYTGTGGGYKGRAIGICQWLGPRRTMLLNRYGHNSDLAQQLDFMWWELNNNPTEIEAKRRWLSATNLEDAVAGAAYFERNDSMIKGTTTVNRNHSIFKKTYNYAQRIYNTMSPTGYVNASTPSNPQPRVNRGEL